MLFYSTLHRTLRTLSVIYVATLILVSTIHLCFASPHEREAANLSRVVSYHALSSEKTNSLVKLINLERTKAGVHTLEIDWNLAKVAEQHAVDMITAGYFGHVSPTTGTLAARLRKAKIQFSRAAENLAGCTTIELAHKLLMESAPHKANILSSRFSKVGVAVVEGGPYGMMIVEIFLSEPQTTSSNNIDNAER